MRWSRTSYSPSASRTTSGWKASTSACHRVSWVSHGTSTWPPRSPTLPLTYVPWNSVVYGQQAAPEHAVALVVDVVGGRVRAEAESEEAGLGVADQEHPDRAAGAGRHRRRRWPTVPGSPPAGGRRADGIAARRRHGVDRGGRPGGGRHHQGGRAPDGQRGGHPGRASRAGRPGGPASRGSGTTPRPRRTTGPPAPGTGASPTRPVRAWSTTHEDRPVEEVEPVGDGPDVADRSQAEQPGPRAVRHQGHAGDDRRRWPGPPG